MAKEYATHKEMGLPVPDFAPARDALTAHKHSGSPYGWCDSCRRMKADPIHEPSKRDAAN